MVSSSYCFSFLLLIDPRECEASLVTRYNLPECKFLDIPSTQAALCLGLILRALIINTTPGIIN